MEVLNAVNIHILGIYFMTPCSLVGQERFVRIKPSFLSAE